MSSAPLNRLNQLTLSQLLVATMMVKLVLVMLIPVTGDEAYFYSWGLNPALTFYDHPPLTGWLLTLVDGLLGWMGAPILVLRLPAVLITTLAGALIYRHISRYYNAELALPVTAIYLLLPLNLIAGFIYTTDTLLLLFSLLALLAIDRAHRDERLSLYLIAGIWIGLAINTKYLSAIPATAIGLYLLINIRKLGVKPLLLYVAAATPFILFNLYINSQTCWTNIAFNLYSRNVESNVGWSNPALFIGNLLYLVAPLLLIYYSLIKQRKWGGLNGPLGQTLLLALLLFFALSIFKSVGLHWLLSITLLVIFPALLIDNRAILWRGFRYTLIFSLLHVMLLLGTIIYINFGLDKDVEHEADIYRTYFISTHEDELLKLASQYEYDSLAANNYSLASIIGFGIQQPVSVIGHGSSYGRQDDFITDYRQLDGKNILIIFSRKAVPELERYFSDYSMETPPFGGGKIHIALGKGFNYPRYLKEVLQPTARHYYKGLPFTDAGSCPFSERYL
ncbi:MAG: glycosyltransferase family 39 protein [Gammaproteobacteria bacterium]|nr:glycosyltransferase family 39 protein [Gammaproteobacteria bacterium]